MDYIDVSAKMLRALREQEGLSKSKMADKMGVDERTYSRFERGEASPSLALSLQLLQRLNKPALPIITRYLYPDDYGTVADADNPENVRKKLATYILRDVTERTARQLAYFLFEEHGSITESQMQLICALDHLPMDVRLLVAKIVLNFWEIESSRGGILNTESVMPDMALLKQTIIDVQTSIIEKK